MSTPYNMNFAKLSYETDLFVLCPSPPELYCIHICILYICKCIYFRFGITHELNWYVQKDMWTNPIWKIFWIELIKKSEQTWKLDQLHVCRCRFGNKSWIEIEITEHRHVDLSNVVLCLSFAITLELNSNFRTDIQLHFFI